LESIRISLVSVNEIFMLRLASLKKILRLLGYT
jgi:hypothetical protein